MLGKANFLGISIDAISSEKGVLEYEPGSLLRMGGATPGSLHRLFIAFHRLDGIELLGEHLFEISSQVGFR